MNEADFLQRWNAERAMYEAWGHFVVDFISEELVSRLKQNPKVFLKIPASSRVKEDDSLIDKAFYRGKGYGDPYNDIEDKVGARFVVMLVSDVDDICGLIEIAANEGKWNAIKCRDFMEERRKSPTLFTYQSHHFIIRSNRRFLYKNIYIEENIPCEVQVRSLLQHAYAELTHDVIYKQKTSVAPEVQRTVAKTMAFIETADDFFKTVTDTLATEPLKRTEKFLDKLFEDFTGKKPIKLKSSLYIYDYFQSVIDDKLEGKILKFINSTPGLDEIIRDGTRRHVFYSQSVIIFVYWLVRHRRSTVERDWPLDWKLASDVALDLNLALNRQT